MNVRRLGVVLATGMILGSAAVAAPPFAPAPVPPSAPTGGGSLPVGTTGTGATVPGQGATFRFQATSAGILTVVIWGAPEVDLVLLVTDEDGQQLQNGRSDGDIGGVRSCEQAAVTITTPGNYNVRVTTFGSGGAASFRIGASWLPFPELATAPDPDGRPGTAVALTLGAGRDDTLNTAAGDSWDWFSIRSESAGMVTVMTRCDGGDLVLEAYAQGAYDTTLDRSDQDMQSSRGNEAVNLQVQPGQTYYLKVATFGSTTGPLPYRLTAGFIPQ